jgi:hypothetical protein
MEQVINVPDNTFKIESWLICQKCKMIIDNPYEISCCGTLFCFQCIIYSREASTCSKCFRKSDFRENSFVKRILNQMEIPCAFKCGGKFRSGEIKSHMLTCELREYLCNFCEKDIKRFQGKKKEFLLHMIESHETELLNYNDDFFKINKPGFNKPQIFKLPSNLDISYREEIKENQMSFNIRNNDDDNSDLSQRIRIPRLRIPPYGHNVRSHESNIPDYEF